MVETKRETYIFNSRDMYKSKARVNLSVLYRAFYALLAGSSNVDEFVRDFS